MDKAVVVFGQHRLAHNTHRQTNVTVRDSLLSFQNLNIRLKNKFQIAVFFSICIFINVVYSNVEDDRDGDVAVQEQDNNNNNNEVQNVGDENQNEINNENIKEMIRNEIKTAETQLTAKFDCNIHQ